MKRTLVFIDANAFKHFLTQTRNTALTDENFNYSAFAEWLVQHFGRGTEELIRGYLYAALPVKDFGTTPAEKEKTKELLERKEALIRRISESGQMTVQLGHTQVLSSTTGTPVFHEKGVDVRMVSDITRFTFIGDYEVFYILTADNDIAYCLHTARDYGKLVKWVNISTGYQTERMVLAKESDMQLRIQPSDLMPFRIKEDKAPASSPAKTAPQPTPIHTISSSAPKKESPRPITRRRGGVRRV